MKRLTTLLTTLGLSLSPVTTASVGVFATAMLTASTAQAADVNVTLSHEEASKTYTLNLGPGSLAIITLPDPARNVLVTRSGVVEATTSDNHIILGGVSATGSVPVQFTTENGMWTWRIKMSNANAGNIVNIKIQSPDEGSANDTAAATVGAAPATVPATQTVSSVAPAPQTLGLNRSTPPTAAGEAASPSAPATANDFLKLTAADMPTVRFNAQRDGNLVILTYRVQAGTRGLSIDERNLKVKGAEGSISTKPTLTSLNFGGGETRYGTIILNDAAAGVAQVEWPYRIGTVTQTLAQNIVLP